MTTKRNYIKLYLKEGLFIALACSTLSNTLHTKNADFINLGLAFFIVYTLLFLAKYFEFKSELMFTSKGMVNEASTGKMLSQGYEPNK